LDPKLNHPGEELSFFWAFKRSKTACDCDILVIVDTNGWPLCLRWLLGPSVLQMRSWSHSLHSLAALAVRARIPQHQSCRAASSQAASTTSVPKDTSHTARDSASKAEVKIPELLELARPLGLPDPPRTTPLTEEEKLAKYLDPQKRLEERNHLCVVNQLHRFTFTYWPLSTVYYTTFRNSALDLLVGLTFWIWVVAFCWLGSRKSQPTTTRM